MASSFTVELEDALLDHILGNQAMPTFTSPRIILTSVHGGRTAQGQEVTVTGGYTGYKVIDFANSSNGNTSNSVKVSWDNMPECIVAGYEIWSSDGTLRMIAVGLSGGPKVLAASSSVIINIGKIALFCT